MEEFKPTKFNLSAINNGKGKYNNGDSVQSDTINAVVEGAAWVQALGTNQPNNSEVNNVGTPSVSIETLSDGTPRFKFDNLNSNCVKSPVETSAFISGQNTLKDAQPTFSVESNNRFDYDNASIKLAKGTFSKIENGYTATGGTGGSWDAAYDNGWFSFENVALQVGEIFSFDYKIVKINVPGFHKLVVALSGGVNGQGKSVSEGETGRIVYVVKEPSNGKQSELNSIHIALSSMTVEITNVCISKVTDTYTPYLADGTAVNVKVNNRNLFDFYNAVYQKCTQENGVITISDKSNEALVILSITQLRGKTLTISGDVNNKGNGIVCIQYATATSFIRQDFVNFTTDTHFVKTFTVDNRATVIKLQIPAGNADLTRLQSIMMVYGDTEAKYEAPVYKAITTAVGQSINITQYDNITNLSVLTEGAVASGQFILSTQYELNDKLTPLFGKFARRPTTTQPYAILYIATDQTGENKVTILPANTDGSVSGNWISI